jgi:hypothetical protein
VSSYDKNWLLAKMCPSDQEQIEELKKKAADLCSKLAFQTMLTDRAENARSFCLEELEKIRTTNAKTVADIHNHYSAQIKDLVLEKSALQQQVNTMTVEEVSRLSEMQRLTSQKQQLETYVARDQISLGNLKASKEALENAHKLSTDKQEGLTKRGVEEAR